MRKVYLLEIILAIWLIVLIMLFLPLIVKAGDSGGGGMIAFTFDDGPNSIQTKRLLDGLSERNAKATFFVVGEKLDFESDRPNIEENRALVERMVREGHEIGNHTYTHCWLNKISEEKVAFELSKTNELIKEITGSTPKYMRPPGGSALTAPWVRKLSSPMITVCWGYYDTRDWQCRNVDKMVKTIVENTFDGDIILLHDNYETSVETALRAMDILAKQGYRFVTIDELLNRNTGNGWELDPMRIYCTMRPGDRSHLKQVES